MCQNFFLKMCYLKLADKILSSVADLHSKISDVPPRSKFFQFHAVFGKIWQNRMLAPLPQGLAPPPRVNPGSATGAGLDCLQKKKIFFLNMLPEIVDMEAVFPCLLALLLCSSPLYVSNSILNSFPFFLFFLDRFLTRKGNFILTLNNSLKCSWYFCS